MRRPANRLLTFLIFTALFLGGLGLAGEAGVPHSSHKTFLNSATPVEQNPYFKQLLHHKENGLTAESLKIAYLISRVRDSSCQFIRNGEIHSGSKAAAHLSRKYRKMTGKIKSALDFVKKIASRSESSGKPYLIRNQNEVHPAEEYLLAELTLLEDKLYKA